MSGSGGCSGARWCVLTVLVVIGSGVGGLCVRVVGYWGVVRACSSEMEEFLGHFLPLRPGQFMLGFVCASGLDCLFFICCFQQFQHVGCLQSVCIKASSGSGGGRWSFSFIRTFGCVGGCTDGISLWHIVHVQSVGVRSVFCANLLCFDSVVCLAVANATA